jgi:hypothetical protein
MLFILLCNPFYATTQFAYEYSNIRVCLRFCNLPTYLYFILRLVIIYKCFLVNNFFSISFQIVKDLSTLFIKHLS